MAGKTKLDQRNQEVPQQVRLAAAAPQMLKALLAAANALPPHTQSAMESRTEGCPCAGCVVREAIFQAAPECSGGLYGNQRLPARGPGMFSTGRDFAGLAEWYRNGQELIMKLAAIMELEAPDEPRFASVYSYIQNHYAWAVRSAELGEDYFEWRFREKGC